MPNWCSNQIEITGDKEGLSQIKGILESNPNGSMFELLVGKLADGQTEEQYAGDWYDTNIERWGCKWDVDIELDSMTIDEDGIHFYLETAWSPCNEFLRLLHHKYGVFVKNEYSEQGNDFVGIYQIGEDELLVDDCWEYLEGLYNTDYEHFIMEVQNQIEYLMGDDEIPSVEEWLKEFPYASMDCLVELQEMFILETS